MPRRHHHATPDAPCSRCSLPSGSAPPCDGPALKRGPKGGPRRGPNPEVRFTPTREDRAHLDRLAMPGESDADVCRCALAACPTRSTLE